VAHSLHRREKLPVDFLFFKYAKRHVSLLAKALKDEEIKGLYTWHKEERGEW